MSGERDKTVEKKKLLQNKQLENKNRETDEQSKILKTIKPHQSEPRVKI